MKTPLSNWLRWILGIIASFVLAVGFFIFLTYLANWVVMARWNSAHGIPFDQTTWQTERYSTNNEPIRLRMIDDLLFRHKLNGLTRDQIVNLLGPAEDDRISDWDIVYSLGPNRGFMRMDTEFLAIQFNQQCVVSDHKLITN